MVRLTTDPTKAPTNPKSRRLAHPHSLQRNRMHQRVGHPKGSLKRDLCNVPTFSNTFHEGTMKPSTGDADSAVQAEPACLPPTQCQLSSGSTQRASMCKASPYLIFVIFSPRAQFLAKFFSTQNRVNRTKTDFATKQRKLQKKLIWQQNIVKCNKTP